LNIDTHRVHVRQPMPTHPGHGVAVVVEDRPELGQLF
jgi:hypothetical protein